jgi:hypothetical protein
MPYPWYEVTNGPILEQGDFLTNCLAPLPPSLPRPAGEAPPAPIPADEYDRVVVLSQSCDLADAQLKRVMVCPAYTLDQFLQAVAPGAGKDKLKAQKDALRKGRRPAYHLLNRCELAKNAAPHLVCDFADAFAIPLEYASHLTMRVPKILTTFFPEILATSR